MAGGSSPRGRTVNGFHVFICHTVKLANPVLSNVVDPCRLDAAAETNTGSTGLHFKSKMLGKFLDVLRSQTTLFASAFQALIPPLAVPMSSNLSDLHSHESALTSDPQYIVAFLDDAVDESYVQILTVPSIDELAIFDPDAENRHRLIGLEIYFHLRKLFLSHQNLLILCMVDLRRFMEFSTSCIRFH